MRNYLLDGVEVLEYRQANMDDSSNGVKSVRSGAETVNLGFVTHTWVTIEGLYRGKRCKLKGQVLDERNSRMSESITIYNVLDCATRERMAGHYTFFKREILSVLSSKHQEWPHDPNKVVFSPNESVMDTILITNKKELDSLIKSISDVTEIGCYMEVDRGRFGRCDYILMNVKNVFIVILVERFGNCSEQLWTALGKHIFSNEGVLKVFFDCIEVPDYLYHKHSIRLRNTYDLKVVYTKLIKMKHLEPLRNCSHKLQPQSSQKRERNEQCKLWELYLSNSVPIMEYVIMEDSSQQSREVTILRKQMVLKVKYLLILKDEMQKSMLQPVTFLMKST